MDDVQLGHFMVHRVSAPTVSKLGQTLQEVKGLVHDVHDENVDDVAVGKVMLQRGTAPTNSKLEWTLQEVRAFTRRSIMRMRTMLKWASFLRSAVLLLHLEA